MKGENSGPTWKKLKRATVTEVTATYKRNPWVDMEAIHSGDELSEGGSEYSEVMMESDRDFVIHEPEDGESPSYEQSAVYHHSLLSQTEEGNVPVFRLKPVKRGGANFEGGSNLEGGTLLSSSPT